MKQVTNRAKIGEELTSFTQLVSQYNDVFSGLGLIKAGETIHLDKTIQPVFDPLRCTPYAMQDIVDVD